MSHKIDLYDTTLRDGAQGKNIALSVADKIRVALLIDRLGVQYIEGGWPGSNPKDTEFFGLALAGDLPLNSATLTAFGSTRRPKTEAANDPQLEGLLNSQAPVICLVGKSWDVHVREALRTDLEENLAMVFESVALLRNEGRRVFFDAEQFFGGHASNSKYAIEVVDAAIRGGAECIILCDTLGGTLPCEIAETTRKVVQLYGDSVRVGIHAHNDSECAVANSLLAVRQGASQIQGTVNGVGERCGNANLISIIANLKMKMGIEVNKDEDLKQLTGISHEIDSILGRVSNEQAPFVGNAAFTHKAGLHASALIRHANLYQHLDPESVGNAMALLVSELAGRSSVIFKAKQLGLGIGIDPEIADRIVKRVKELEIQGYSFENAEASFELLARLESGQSIVSFGLKTLLIASHLANDQIGTEVSLEVSVDGAVLKGNATAANSFEALNLAFSRAIVGRFPTTETISLNEYTVRGIALTSGKFHRVSLAASDGRSEWYCVGVAEDPIHAFWKALSDAYAFFLIPRLVRQEVQP